ncbi:hypothetical protein HZA56_18465 [Candidatus Poribacteria bacterium]|nr:hypothetical protein [Candidatus Poribacteria bacterium]
MRIGLAVLMLWILLLCGCETTTTKQVVPQGSQVKPESVVVGGEVKVRAQHQEKN